jgi:hypothetical protein
MTLVCHGGCSARSGDGGQRCPAQQIDALARVVAQTADTHLVLFGQQLLGRRGSVEAPGPGSSTGGGADNGSGASGGWAEAKRLGARTGADVRAAYRHVSCSCFDDMRCVGTSGRRRDPHVRSRRRQHTQKLPQRLEHAHERRDTDAAGDHDDLIDAPVPTHD